MRFLILLITISINSFASERTICFATINSPDEKELFKKYTAGQGFKYVELTELGGVENRDQWFENSCSKNISCDILVVSGHFGGNFFGSSGLSLSTNDLEKKSCDNSCDSILKNVKEVFLFGCNTLASKDKDHRTPEEYLQVLLEDDIDRPDAERIVEARYGTLGQSFKERMQRIFAEVPHIYGFHSVGPSGKNVRPFLKKYFEKNPNYKDRIEKVEAQKLVNQVNSLNDAFKNFNNSTWSSSMNGTAHAQCSGIMPNDPAFKHKETICNLYDPYKTTSEQVDTILDMLSSDDYMLFMPSISNFVNGGAQWDESFKKELQENLKTERFKNILENIIKSFKDAPAMTLDYLSMMNIIGFISDEDLNKRKRKIMYSLLKNPSREQLDSLCSITGEYDINNKTVLSDLPYDFDLTQPQNGLMLLCLDVQDPNITKLALKAIDKTSDPTDIAYLLIAYGNLPGYDEEALTILKKNRDKATKQYQKYVDVAILKKETNNDYLLSKVNEMLENPAEEYLLYDFFEDYDKKNDQLAMTIINTKNQKSQQEYLSFVMKIANPKNEKIMEKFFQLKEKLEENEQAHIRNDFFYEKNICFNSCKKYLINKLKKLYNTYSIDGAYYAGLANSKLNESEINEILKIANSIKISNEYNLRYLRYIVSQQKDFIHREDVKEFIKGPKSRAYCDKINPHYTTCGTEEID